jgi:hypothetical protein
MHCVLPVSLVLERALLLVQRSFVSWHADGKRCTGLMEAAVLCRVRILSGVHAVCADALMGLG